MGVDESNMQYQYNNIREDRSNIELQIKLNEPNFIPIGLIFKANKSICKIIIKKYTGNLYGTGFFMKISETQKYLITNYHVINQNNINDDFEIEIYNKKTMKLNLNNREINYFPRPKDITMIEINNNDEIYNDILFLDYDLNYQKGYSIMYQNAPIFLIQYPYGENIKYACGKIVNINDFEFDHDISTESGASGSPIILYTKNVNSIQVIGIHKEANYTKNLNTGTFIGEIFSEYHYIIAEINIKENDINKNIRLINSNEFSNEKEIKKCEIRINDKLMPFNYFYKFIIKGKYIIKYSFNNYLIKTNYMFYDCSALSNINLSHFNTKKVSDMSFMFWGCTSLTNINLSGFNTQNVKDMSYMFDGCSSLLNVNLSNFNTQNVTDMSSMFRGCTCLSSINLSNFNTQNVTKMNFMFALCSSLKNLDLSNFNTKNVNDMSYMFDGCSSLTNINLSNFNTQNVTKMSYMFSLCSSLININISNFNTQNVKDMSYMFDGCSILTNINLSNFNTQKVPKMSKMFCGCKSLINVYAKDNKVIYQFYDDKNNNKK